MATPQIRTLHSPDHPRKRVLFLGYDARQTTLIDMLIAHDCAVDHAGGAIDGTGAYDFAVSFGYRHILRKSVLDRLGCPIINLHISYLPFNRGAHPNFWSFYDDTPAGVTLHLIDEGVDTGPIIAQRLVVFDQSEVTFAQTYARLVEEITDLFSANLLSFLSDSWRSLPQSGVGTHHLAADLPGDFAGWDSHIASEISRLRDLG